MTITKTSNKSNVTLSIEGSLDTFSCVQFSDEIDSVLLDGAVNLYFNLKGVSYICSSGLRILLATQKKVTALGTKMEIIGANETVKGILDVTGFAGVLTIK